LARLLEAAADAVAAVQAGRSLTQALAAVAPPLRPGTQALAFHAMRWLGGAMAARQALVPRPPPAAVESLLLLSLSLLWPAGSPPYPAHTLVDQAVACARRRSPASAGFVNAVLRRFGREAATLVPALEATHPEARWQHPRWWIEHLQQDWPRHWEALLTQANTRPPMTLRVNARRSSAAAYAQALAARGLQGRPIGPQAIQAVQLATPAAVDDLPGFADGWVSVQDVHAQLAAPLVIGHGAQALRPGARVLDACAAPGGKTAHLLELADLDVLALDVDSARLARVKDTLDRLGLQATLLAADAGQPETWWDGRPFDAVLLDAPCSASGIVRRHADVRWLRRASDIDALARVQSRLLDALWPVVAPGGRIVYATCSLFKAEGEQQIDAFMQRQPLAQRLAAPGHIGTLADNAQSGSAAEGLDGDGFFYAVLAKQAA
jgi:16S rRNA (cytosine967-C5)-methyltransferase